MELWKLRLTFSVAARNPGLILRVATAPHPFGRFERNLDLALTEAIQTRFFKAHPDGLMRTSEFEIYLQRKPHLLSATVIRTGVQEPATSNLVRSLLNRTSRFVDVGANIGWFSLLAAGRAASVSAFEPESSNVELLRRSVQQNGFENVQVSEIAIGDHNGVVPLWISEESAGRHSTVWKTGATQRQVQCRTLDSLFPIETIDLLKLEVEGAEPEVIEGAAELIGTRRLKSVIMEWNPASWEGRLTLLDPFQLYQIDGATRFVPGRRPIDGNILLRIRGELAN